MVCGMSAGTGPLAQMASRKPFITLSTEAIRIFQQNPFKPEADG
jgi:hypothetical protein